jgi:hypothetical protein
VIELKNWKRKEKIKKIKMEVIIEFNAVLSPGR